jgi:phage terminase large subunit-like protein
VSFELPPALTTSVLEYLSTLPEGAVQEWVLGLPPELLEEINRREWWFVRRPNQTAPPGDWFIWLILAGRGFGKNRTASEWLVEKVLENPLDVAGHPTEWAAVGETLQDCRKAMFGGPSGMLNVLARKRIRFRYQRFPAPTITLAAGQIIHGLGADDEDVGRGLNLAGAWLDELAKWRKPNESWTGGLGPALRTKMPGGTKPQVLATTTPKPIPLLRDWTTRTDGSVVVTRGSTFDNAANLSAAAVKEFVRQYGRSQLGRQELYGELLTVIEGALWRHEWIEALRVRRRRDVPALSTVAIAIDPAITDKVDSDETGLVAVGRGVDGHDYVLADRSGPFVGIEAARRAWALYNDTAADVVVYEANQGADWVRDVLRTAWNELREDNIVAGNPPLQAVNATRGKRLRAEPIAARYESGEVHHVGRFEKLEAQMTEWLPSSGTSPDRLDALVHGIAFLSASAIVEASVATPLTMHRPIALPRGASVVYDPHAPRALR